jgi:hypothetical protein
MAACSPCSVRRANSALGSLLQLLAEPCASSLFRCALRAAVRQSARARLAERIASGAGIDRSEALLAQTRPTR